MTIMNWLAIAIILVVFILGRLAFTAVIRRIGNERDVGSKRVLYVLVVVNTLWVLLALTALSLAAGVGFSEYSVFFSSFIAILGVALFAQWSILSNVTASVIVFFFFPYRVGHRVRIIDGDNSIEGVIKEITLFHVILDGEDGIILTYPNSMVFQKAVSIVSEKEAPLKLPVDEKNRADGLD